MSARKGVRWAAAVAVLALSAGGCAINPTWPPDPPDAPARVTSHATGPAQIDAALEDRILALDPAGISEADVREVLARGPAPRIVNVHGGIHPVHLTMLSFTRFLVAMGYPEGQIRAPRDGAYSLSCYEDSAKLAGFASWYYEQEGMRPMFIGHSQGGMQIVKVLHQLAGAFSRELQVWNPLTDRAEQRTVITDPLSGRQRPVVGLSLSYASAVGAGGAAMLLPNQWAMWFRLRTIPDTVDEFTGFFVEYDHLAWDLPGADKRAPYRASGSARVRNVALPAYVHGHVPETEHLARDPVLHAWIGRYVPPAHGEPAPAVPEGDNRNALWAAEVWYSIRQHWASEAQRLVRARRAARGAAPERAQ